MPHTTIGGLLSEMARRWPERPALEYGDACWSYRQLDEQTDLLAAGFLSAGIRRGEHVAMWTDNHPNTILSCYGLLKIGAVPVPLGSCSTREELVARVRDGGCIHLMFSDVVRGIPARAVIPEEGVPGIEGCCFIGEGMFRADCGLQEIMDDGRLWPREALEQARAVVEPDDADVLLFTSGSSGRPKGVLLTHDARLCNARLLAEAMDITEQDRFCCALPLYHCLAFTANAIAALVAGACLILPLPGNTASLLRTLAEKRATVLMGVPTLFSAILAKENLDDYDLSSLRTGLIAGSSYPAALFERARARLRYELLPAYGLTEATGGVTCARRDDSPWLLSHGVGRVLAHTEVEIRGEEGAGVLPPGAVGEIWIRGRCVMKGYYPQDGAVPAGGPDEAGWFATGDMGRMDEAGNLFIVGRIKELIIRGGENISPAEIEQALGSDERVAAIKVVGVPDAHYIEEVCACILPAGPITEQEVKELARQLVGPRKMPHYVLLMEQFPQTATGKMDGKGVRRLAMERLGLQELPTE